MSPFSDEEDQVAVVNGGDNYINQKPKVPDQFEKEKQMFKMRMLQN
jgi:hypothetical protein